MQYNARNFAAVKLVRKVSQWRMTRGEKNGSQRAEPAQVQLSVNRSSGTRELAPPGLTPRCRVTMLK
ncbi:hypothetical protein EVAR_93627_1 [Eumeta japonica]|uniref:Uncharacterized protein n=1 Tax=Eumeta variegata TaxID=151549 RepID=A0A4C1TQM8_EUMVA|nr:hypothetical protein EVAR_93627_1 [Eumeta japonica]